MKFKKITISFLVVFTLTILAKLMAFLSELVISYYLGTSYKADAFNTLNGVHLILYPMLSLGIWAVFMPVYKKISVTINVKEADILANKILNLFILISLVFSVVLFFFADIIVGMVAPGFNHETKLLTTDLLQIVSIQYVFIIIASIYSAMLEAHKKFFASKIREIVSYLPLFILGFFYYDEYGVKVFAYALVFGSILRFLIVLPFLNWGYKFRIDLDLKNKNVIEIFKNFPAAITNAAVIQLNTLVDRMLSSTLEIGAVSSLSYGQRLVNVFNGIVSTAIATVWYPTATELVAKNEKRELKNHLIKIIYLISAVMIPVTFISVFYSADIVSTIFERGAFEQKSVTLTSLAFTGYILGLCFYSYKEIIDVVFYSNGDTKMVMKISIVTVLSNIILNLILINILGVFGLSLATSLASMIGFIYSFFKIKKYVNIHAREITSELIKIIVASLISSTIAYIIYKYFMFALLLKLLSSVFITIIFYSLFLIIFKAKTIRIIIGYIKY